MSINGPLHFYVDTDLHERLRRAGHSPYPFGRGRGRVFESRRRRSLDPNP